MTATLTVQARARRPAWGPAGALFLLLAGGLTAFAAPLQQPEADPILAALFELESVSDAKCNSTASRFEDFLFGTPLSAAAREKKTELQKDWVLDVWGRASELATSRGRSTLGSELVVGIIDNELSTRVNTNGNVTVTFASNESIELSQVRVSQYSSIAFSLRVVLAVQQDLLVSGQPRLATLDPQALNQLTASLDLVTVSALGLADRQARLLDLREVSPELLRSAWARVAPRTARATRWTTALGTPLASADEPTLAEPTGSPAEALHILMRLIEEKLLAYEAYNEIDRSERMKLLVRNIESFYAVYPVATSPGGMTRFLGSYQTLLDRFTVDLLLRSQQAAIAKRHPLIRADDAIGAVDFLAPHELDDFEDIHFYPNLESDLQVRIESYDADSFRDLGLHWWHLRRAYQTAPEPPLALDPFAAEILTEAVSQYAVVVLRLAGREARRLGIAPSLRVEDLEWAAKVSTERARLHRETPPRQASSEPIRSAQGPVSRGAFFSDVTAESGVRFLHRSSPWLSEFRRQRVTGPPSFSGGGIAAEDIDGDGDPDLLLVGGGGNTLLLNSGSGRFEDVTDAVGLVHPSTDRTSDRSDYGEARQPIIVDFDNDGHQDILITYANGPHRLYRNLGTGVFENVTERGGLGGKGLIAGPVAVFDFDGDGLLDIYIGYFGNYLEGALPLHDRDSRNASPNQLFRNLGDFRFTNVTAGSGTDDTGWAQAVSHTDFNGDGRQDIIVANDYGRNAFLVNRGQGRFENVAERLGLTAAYHSMNVGITDLNRDGFPDIYISNIATMVKDNKYVLPDPGKPLDFTYDRMATMLVQESNRLYMSHVEGQILRSYQVSADIERGPTSTGWAWDAEFFDLDHDGDDDLYVVNGSNEYNALASHYWEEVDERGRPRYHHLDYDRESNVLFVNEDGKLRNRSLGSGADFRGNSRSTAYLDIEGDGDLDIAVNNFHGPATLLRNDGPKSGGWLKITLEGDPKQGVSRDAIGARLVLTSAEGLWAYRQVLGGSGYLSMNPKQQHFGTGSADAVDLDILWPNGARDQVTGLEVNASYRVALGGLTTRLD